jgi:negative regulator of replication initiation
MKRIKYIATVLLIVLSGCSVFKEGRRSQILHSMSSVDSATDTLIAHYGNKVSGDSILSVEINRLSRRLDSLEAYLDSSDVKRSREFVLATQQYVTDVRFMILLSNNANLNLQAFAETLSSLSRSRSKVRAMLMNNRRKLSFKT